MIYFITAIGTDSGKTFVSAILTEALQADYWKPIQSGLPRDTETVAELVSNSVSKFHKEAYTFTQPLSPHAAALLDKNPIQLTTIQKPITTNTLVVEGAGGVLVPLTDNDFVIDLATHLQAEVILVINFYLGSINHTLLTLNELQKREQLGQFKVKGIIFNGTNKSSEAIVRIHCPYPCLVQLDKETNIDKATILKYAKKIQF